jgi:hypothetical protein
MCVSWVAAVKTLPALSAARTGLAGPPDISGVFYLE